MIAALTGLYVKTRIMGMIHVNMTIRRDGETVYFIPKIMTKLLLSFHNQNYTIYSANEARIAKYF